MTDDNKDLARRLRLLAQRIENDDDTLCVVFASFESKDETFIDHGIYGTPIIGMSLGSIVSDVCLGKLNHIPESPNTLKGV